MTDTPVRGRIREPRKHVRRTEHELVVRHVVSADPSRAVVLELQSELAIIKEIDTRTAHRDVPGTNGGVEIAKGETERRVSHVARARELMSRLQLGSTDEAYLKARLAELASVFPGIEKTVVPAIEKRIERRAKRADAHRRAGAIRKAREVESGKVAARLAQGTFKTERIVIGSGPSGLADVATLGVAKTDAMIDPEKLLVIGGPDLIDRIDPGFAWGQRAAAYDRPTNAHPAFSDANGVGTGELHDVVEDHGDFMQVGEMRDAMDLARDRLGMVSVNAQALEVETLVEKRHDSPEWAQPGTHVRTRMLVDGKEVYVYSDFADVTPGPGNPRLPGEPMLATKDRDAMMGHTMFTGDQLLERTADVRGKRVLVLGIGPTGAWSATAAHDMGAARVDWAHLAGGENGAGGRPMGKNAGRSNVNTASSSTAYEDTMALDRTQPAIDPKNEIHSTLDRILSIEPSGAGVKVTFAHGPAEDFVVYSVEYDVVLTALGYVSSTVKGHPAWSKPAVQDMIGTMAMEPDRNSTAPITSDKATGRVRVMGYAAGDMTNIGETGDVRRFVERAKFFTSLTSADSPDHRVVEGVGIGTREANGGMSK